MADGGSLTSGYIDLDKNRTQRTRTKGKRLEGGVTRENLSLKNEWLDPSSLDDGRWHTNNLYIPCSHPLSVWGSWVRGGGSCGAGSRPGGDEDGDRVITDTVSEILSQ